MTPRVVKKGRPLLSVSPSQADRSIFFGFIFILSGKRQEDLNNRALN
jgi:hypothetical protein